MHIHGYISAIPRVPNRCQRHTPNSNQGQSYHASKNVSELKDYLGMLTYHSKFLPNLATVVAPLYPLLQKDTHWTWKTTQAESSQQSKGMLTSSSVLTHYNPDIELTLACDASPYGLGTMSYCLSNVEEKPIAYTSHILSQAEQNYKKKSFLWYLEFRNSISTCMVDGSPYTQIINLYKVCLTLGNQLHQWSHSGYNIGH